jgi:hypothetical protein
MRKSWWLDKAPCPSGASLNKDDHQICCVKDGIDPERLGPCLNVGPDGRPYWFRVHSKSGIEGWTVSFLDRGFTAVERRLGASNDHTVHCVRDDRDSLLGQYELDGTDRVRSAELLDCQRFPWGESERGAAELQSHCRPGTIADQDVLVRTSCPSSRDGRWCTTADTNGLRLATPSRPIGGPMRGTDSRVGEYRAGPFTIAYDKGLYSGDGCPEPGDLEWREDAGATFRTRMYKRDDAIVVSRTWPGLAVTVTVADPNQIEIAKKILATVAFDGLGKSFDERCR